jgi:hypothetical protein
MSGFELDVKPILEELGLFNGKEVSAKKAFENYLKAFPDGIGPLGVFIGLSRNKFNLNVKKVFDGGILVDFIFSFHLKNGLLNYDPRKH